MKRNETIEAFENPRPGMRFHEMYSYWVYILLISDEGLVTIRTFSGHPANPYRETSKIRTFGSVQAFQAEFRRNTGDYGLFYCDDKAFERMKDEVMVTAEDIERGYTLS